MKLLTIGNSLSNDAMAFFPAMAESAGEEIEYFGANIGGLSLEQHALHLNTAIKEAESNVGSELAPGQGGPYTNPFYPPRPLAGSGTSLLAALKAAPWDYVTLQQVTGLSFVSESFEPHCAELIAAIHQYAPTAKIAMYQTWAFREDFPDFATLGFDQEGMYRKIKRAYGNVARANQLGTVPAGWAFQLARQTPPWKFQFPDPEYNYQAPAPGILPSQPGSLNSGWGWGQNAETGEPVLDLDFKHANSAGKYLAGAVFYESLYGDCAENIRYVPPDLTCAEAESLKSIAHLACTTYCDDGS
jgi:hypothetical protein